MNMKGQLPKRRLTRLRGYDYSAPGAYFITVCVKNRKEVLGHIVGCGACDAPQMTLSNCGKILNARIQFMSNKYPHICIDKYVIMPNHFHLLLSITDYAASTSGSSQAPNPTNSEISKFVSLLKRYCNQAYRENIWQTSYHDHIIRNEQDYRRIWRYIDTNVIRWERDCFYTEKTEI